MGDTSTMQNQVDGEVKAQPSGKAKSFSKKKSGNKPGKFHEPKQTTAAIKPHKPVERTLPPPSAKRANDESTIKKVTNESLLNESVFATDNGFSTRREIRFTPSATGWTSTVDDTFAELRNDKATQVTKEFPIEAFRYYCAGLFWLYSISLKLQQGQGISQAEVQVHRNFEGKILVGPEPIHLGLKAIGRTTTRNGETIAPVLPELPTQVTGQIPGTLGVYSANNHNTYEDYPVMGPVYQGCYERAQTTERRAYQSVVAVPNTTANRNLQGYDSLKTIRADLQNILIDMGFDEGIRPPTIENSGISYNTMKTVSNYLAKTSVFKNVEIDVFEIPDTGSLAQIIETRPDPDTTPDAT